MFACIRTLSRSFSTRSTKMKVLEVPVLSDNYSYLLVGSDGTAACVDPAEPDKVLAAAKQNGLNLTYLLTTHHHWDHAGGNEEMAKVLGSSLTVVGCGENGEESRIPAINKLVKDNEEFKIGSMTVKCLYTPCHTRNHILYFVTDSDSEDPVVFTGDTLFIGGCGRFFEGNGKEMLTNMDRIAKLPPNTMVYPGHEYTVANYKFAVSVEKDNASLTQAYADAQAQRKADKPTIPSTVGKELATNPFMRCNEPSVQNILGIADPVVAMDKLREMKNNF